MKYFLILFLILGTSVWAKDPGTNDEKTTAQQNAATEQQVASKFNTADFQKFYIGYSESQGVKKLITVQINSLDSLDNEIQFAYTMNSVDDRKDGEGKILLNENEVQFGKEETGKVYRAEEDGKIVFESSLQDTLNYWKIKEK